MGHHQSNNESIQFSLFEFLLITYAKKIKSFTVHGWPSGFAFIISKIWDIPLECEINLKKIEAYLYQFILVAHLFFLSESF